MRYSFTFHSEFVVLLTKWRRPREAMGAARGRQWAPPAGGNGSRPREAMGVARGRQWAPPAGGNGRRPREAMGPKV